MEPRLRASPEQFSALVEFMERHGDLSKPQSGAQGRIRGDQLWQELTSLLNSIGGGVDKSTMKWKKLWTDWKTKTKKKFLVIRQHASGTGGGPRSNQVLTALEERVVAILGVSAVVGQAGIQEQGFPEPLQDALSLEEPQPNVAEQIQSPVPLAPPASTPLPTTPDISPPRAVLTPVRRRRTRRQVSPRSLTSPHNRHRTVHRTRGGLTPFERASNQFIVVEQRRLQLEEERDRRLHEREMERLRIEAQRLEIAHEQNQLLQNLASIAEKLITVLNNR